MVKREIIEEIRNAFRKFIKENPEVEAILLFGSYAKGEETSRSGVDVCLVIPNVRENVRKGFKIMRKIWREVHLDFKNMM
ncbi:MAG: nucleotidyltransferase domain-containing protein [Thermoprotei archaeon]|nr:nucleotidyltransferase domain-containing protein [Thermoprotei archaeon]